MTQKFVVVTGANRGIGLALTKEYLSRGDTVLGICREASDELKQTGAEILDGVDVTKEDSMVAIEAKVANRPVDILVNNAGVLHTENLGNIDYDDIKRQLDVNALGPLRVTEAVLDNLKSGAKVAVITSRMGSIADNGSGGYYGYRMSKAALNIAAVCLARDLKPRRVAVAILHPGFVQTDMVNHAGDISADISAQRLAQRIDGLNLDNTGTFWHSNGEILPW